MVHSEAAPFRRRCFHRTRRRGMQLAASQSLVVKTSPSRDAGLISSPRSQKVRTTCGTRVERVLPLFGWRRRYWSFLLKLAKDRPSWTLQAHPGPATGPFHWESRRLSVEEMARLQTFPTNVRFAGNGLSIQRQLGNAVPSLLAEILGREIRSQLLAAPITGPHKLAIPLNRPIPPPERVQPIPRKYGVYLGNHSAHPGEGCGPRAQPVHERSLRRAAS